MSSHDAWSIMYTTTMEADKRRRTNESMGLGKFIGTLLGGYENEKPGIPEHYQSCEEAIAEEKAKAQQRIYVCKSCAIPCKLVTKKGHSEPTICPMGVGDNLNASAWELQ
jgi:hypothetical protein